jgi:EmrB/QacA subfamily drug resistance transporter
MTAATTPSEAASADVRVGTRQGRWVLAAAILGSGMAFLDATVINVAVRVIGADLGASLADLQWVLNAYTLMLAALILLGGSLGDRFGRRRVFVFGVVWFALASGACALATSPLMLIVARGVQGIGGALLTPGSLAMIQGSFAAGDRARAIGIWSGLAGVSTAIGPFLGGWLIESVGWRYVFWINVPIALAVVVVAVRHVPETRDARAAHSFDVSGAVLGCVGLAGLTYALIESGDGARTYLAAGVGVAALGAFIVNERRRRAPMVPPALFRSRVFTSSNLLTLLVYGALAALMFLLTLQLQVVTGYSPLQAGVALLPVTALMLVLSGRSGALATRIGPRLQMSLGPLLCAVGALMLLGVGGETAYWIDVLPGVTVFGLGLTALVAPLTATVLAAAPDRYAGIASGVNNAVARAGSLLAVAALPVAVGLRGNDYQDAAVLSSGYRAGMVVCAALLALGGVAGWWGLRRTGAATLRS